MFTFAGAGSEAVKWSSSRDRGTQLAPRNSCSVHALLVTRFYHLTLSFADNEVAINHLNLNRWATNSHG
jgi:hypothetical protein